MSKQDSLAMATSAEQRQQGAGHAMPAGKVTSHKQTQVGIATVALRSIQLALQVPYLVAPCQVPYDARHYTAVSLGHSLCQRSDLKHSCKHSRLLHTHHAVQWLRRKHSMQPRTPSQQC